MIKLSEDEKATLAKVFYDMCQCPLLIGKCDAKHGNEDFMYGISTAMEVLTAYLNNDEIDFTDLYCNIFNQNMLDSEKRAKK